MGLFDACMIAEGVEEATEEQYLEAWQYLVDTGACWKLQGWYGRAARDLIDNGYITEGGES